MTEPRDLRRRRLLQDVGRFWFWHPLDPLLSIAHDIDMYGTPYSLTPDATTLAFILLEGKLGREESVE